ncbi:hypothetical protein KC727_00365 [Candidatus Kaiserbacteria bacterium]|nr:hypothetical protein [Candidatus Kaiserbacteria bacterium]
MITGDLVPLGEHKVLHTSPFYFSWCSDNNIKDIVDEFRVIVIGGKALGVAKKLSNNIAKNATLGGSFEKVEDKEVIDFAEKAAHFEKADILGTDIARTPDGSLWLIENNRNPNFIAFREATGMMVEENILQFVLSKE